MNIKKFLKKISKSLIILVFVFFVISFFDFWVEYPLFAGVLIIILYCILRGAEDRITYFKKRKDKKQRDEDKFI